MIPTKWNWRNVAIQEVECAWTIETAVCNFEKSPHFDAAFDGTLSSQKVQSEFLVELFPYTFKTKFL